MSQSACFFSKILCLVIFWQEAALVLKARGWPRGCQMPGRRAAQNFHMPRSSPGGEWGGWAQLELTDA